MGGKLKMINNRKLFLVYHYYAAASYHWDGPDGVGGHETEDCTVGARTMVILLTGGKSGVARKSLFCINGGANQNGWRTTAYGAYWTTKAVADKTSLQTLGRHFGADGKLWVVLPDNTAQDLTVTAPPDDYDAWPTDASGVQKYTLAIQANNVTLEPDVVVNEAPNF